MKQEEKSSNKVEPVPDFPPNYYVNEGPTFFDGIVVGLFCASAVIIILLALSKL